MKVLIIADDFTGALDTGVHFSMRGVQTLVSTDINLKRIDNENKIDVIVIDTETRHLKPKEAYKIIKPIIKDAMDLQINYIYKKTDSALRGNISSELQALSDFSKKKQIPFLPSYPEMSRIVKNGNLLINGHLVSQSVFSSDPYDPVLESNIIKKIERESALDAYSVNLDTLKNISDAEGIYVCDAKSDHELTRYINLLKRKNLLNITAGNAGFAKVLAKYIFPERNLFNICLRRKMIIISGSINPITKEQIRYAEENGGLRISLTKDQLLSNNYWNTSQGMKDIHHFVKEINRNHLIIFETSSKDTIRDIKAIKNKNNIREKIGNSLGNLVDSLWNEEDESTYLFTGGDTLFQVMKKMNISKISPLLEYEPGIVISKVQYNEQEIPIITKSGGFGDKDLFIELAKGADKHEL